MERLTPIELNLADKLKNVEYRHEFFRSLAQDEIASQIKDLRIRREMRQIDLADRARMKQSTVSRIEHAEYSSWTFTTLRRVAEALNARLRVVFQPIEDAIKEFEDLENATNPSWASVNSKIFEPQPQQEGSASIDRIRGENKTPISSYMTPSGQTNPDWMYRAI